MPTSDPIPAYYKIKLDLLEKMASGAWPIGSQLPTELTLMTHYGVSRPTIRQALLELVHAGQLTRVRGRGTFVSSPLVTKDAQIFTTFAEDMSKQGERHRAVTISKKRVSASRPLAADLNISDGETAFEIVRVRIAHDEPLVLRTSYIAERECPGLLDENLDDEPLYDIIRRRVGQFPTSAHQAFRAVAATPKEAAWLHIPRGAPLLEWEGVVINQHGRPMEKVRALHRGDKFRFVVNQGRLPPQEGDRVEGLGILFQE